MPASSLPPDQARRRQALLDLDILDTAPEERFDRVTRLAARLFDVPIALVSLVDAERQWFKSRIGVAVEQSDLSSSFCAHAILQDGVMEVADALDDPRFAANPMVCGAPNARFYAGYPLATRDGSRIGTLCILDDKPRTLDDGQRALLRDLANILVNEVAALELQRANERRRQDEAWIRVLLQNIPDGVLMLDGDGKVLSANPAAERIFGASQGALAGRSAVALLEGGTAEVIRTLALGDGDPAGDARPTEGGGRRLDGSAFPLELKVSPMRLGAQQRVAAIVRDVTLQRDAEERYRATEELRRKHFTTATHELRTPMASILGFSELLLKREFDPSTSRELLDIIHRQAGRLVDMINQLLDLARIEAGGVQGLHIAPVAVAELVEQTLAGLNGLGQNQRICLDLQPGLPEIAADAQRMQLALTNILSNSIKYSAEGSPITLAAYAVQRHGRPTVAVRVADRGIGMTPEQLAHVYDAFYRAGQKQNVQGSGLGMTIFKEIVDLHGGEAEIASTPGAGTTVTLWLRTEALHG
ncbi:PAS domain S-box protein [Massilia forsythiae]|uniref:histidine kinase n=1 Tax=Massilia forsythiae TaxID=2728020 RepID=A0A7Z2VZV9_9BURK|nr:ATP-binding protein [Massilia forsythiae]QJE01910.1 PAS domain S-box protein [Massilia forsythiae]